MGTVIEPVKLLLYGVSGVGKTTFLGSATEDPRVMPMLLLDLEGGTSSIKSKVRQVTLPELGKPEPGLIDVVRIKTWSDVQQAYNFLFSSVYEKKRSVYKSLAVDSLTEINYLSVRHAVSEDSSPNLDPDVPKIAHYGKSNTQMKKMLRAFRDIEGLHVFYSCLPQTEGGGSALGEGNQVVELKNIKPNLVGKLADEVTALTEMVGYLRTGITRKREMIFQPEPGIIAKERSEMGKHIVKIVDPTITKLLDEIEAKEKQS